MISRTLLKRHHSLVVSVDLDVEIDTFVLILNKKVLTLLIWTTFFLKSVDLDIEIDTFVLILNKKVLILC